MLVVLVPLVLLVVESAQASCTGGLGSTQRGDSVSGYWEIEYDLTGSEFETRNTPFGAADGTYVVGPGTMTIRFESDILGAGGNILDGGDAQIVQLSLTQQFVVRTRVFGLRTDVSTRIHSAIPDNRWDGNPAGHVTPGSGRGTINGETLTIAAPGMRGYHTLGSTLCEGSGCRLGRLRRGVATRVDNKFDAIALRTLHFGPGGPADGAGFSSHRIALPRTDHADPYLRLQGREMRRTFVPPATATTAIAARPCYSVLENEARPAEAFAAE